MARVDDDAKPFVRGDADGEADEEEGETEEAPPAGCVGEDEDDGEDDGADDVGDARVADEEDAGFVTVADAPADEVGVGLAAEGAFDDVADEGEGGGVGRVLEGVEDGGAGFVGEVEFAGGVGGDVVGYYAVDLGAVGLDCDLLLLVMVGLKEIELRNRIMSVHDCHLSPTCALASSTESAALFAVLAMPDMKDCLSN